MYWCSLQVSIPLNYDFLIGWLSMFHTNVLQKETQARILEHVVHKGRWYVSILAQAALADIAREFNLVSKNATRKHVLAS